MPNWVKCVLSFNGNQEKIHEMMDLIKMDDKGIGSIDFNKIVPQPPFLYQGNIGADEEKIYGRRNWYDWNNQYWGTKWNASNDECSNDEEIVFETAWSAPFPVITALSWMFPDIVIKLQFADEDIGCNCGMISYRAGEAQEYDFADDEAAIEFACDLWGYDVEEYLEEIGR